MKVEYIIGSKDCVQCTVYLVIKVEYSIAAIYCVQLTVYLIMGVDYCIKNYVLCTVYSVQYSLLLE